MAQYFIDPTTFNAVDWTIRTGALDQEITTATDILIGATVISFAGGNSVTDSTMSYDPAGTIADVEILTYGRTTSTAARNQLGMAARLLSDSFYLGMTYSSNLLYIGKSVSNSRTFYGNVAGENRSPYAYRRFQVIGSTVRIRDWSGTIADEPTTWDVETTDTTITAAGHVGLYNRHDNADYYQFIGIGTNGDPAPTGPVGGDTPTSSATVSGSAAIASAGYKRGNTTATVTGTASATAASYKRASSNATVTGAASITAVGSAIIPTPTHSATVTGNASIISSGYKSATTTATVTGSSSINATGYKATAIPTGSATVTGNAVITATGYKTAKAQASTTGTGTITSIGSKRATGQASVTGSSSVTAIGSAVVNIPTGQATVSGSAAITSIGYKRAVVNSEVRGDPAITSTGYKIATSSALVTGSASITVLGYNPSSAIKVLQMRFKAHQADIKFTGHHGNITFTRIGV